MAKAAQDSGRWGIPWRMIGWGAAALLLLVPLVAMRYSNEVDWSAADFLFMAALFGGIGLAFEFVVRRSNSVAYRFAAALALLAAFLTIWVNAAVGMIGSEDNRLNLMFGGVLLIALIGAIIARLKPAGMMRAMLAAAIAQAVAGTIGLATDPLGGGLSMGFALPWLLAAALFRKAARGGTIKPS